MSVRKFILLILFIGFFYVSVAWIFGRVDLQVRPDIVSTYAHRNFYDYSGVINIQSSQSTGSGTAEDIAQAAENVKLEFVVITDANDFSADPGRQGYINDVLVLRGGEYSFVDSRLLNMGYKTKDHLQGPGRAQVVLADLLSQKERDEKYGFFVLAHPQKPGYSLPDPLPENLNGIEVFNLKSIWESAWINKRSSFLWALFLYPINMRWSFTRLYTSYQRPEIGIWDAANRKRKLIGFAGADANARARSPLGGEWRIPSYETSFSVLRNHILIKSELTGNFEQDQQKVFQALRDGSFYISLDLIGDPKGFESYLVDKGGKIHGLGSQVSLKSAKKIMVDLPEKPMKEFEVVIYRDGEKMMSSNSLNTEMDLHLPGAYRITVRVKLHFPFEGSRWVDWILTNPFFITEN